MSSPRIQLLPGRRGFVSIVVNAGRRQRTFLDVRRTDGSQVTSATFEGQGERVHANDVFNNRPHWSFGPFNFNAVIHVTITSFNGSSWVGSTMVGPLSIVKQPEPDFPIEFHVSTVISEDRVDNSHDDCTVTVLQYHQ